jgi:hypothetical protein
MKPEELKRIAVALWGVANTIRSGDPDALENAAQMTDGIAMQLAAQAGTHYDECREAAEDGVTDQDTEDQYERAIEAQKAAAARGMTPEM